MFSLPDTITIDVVFPEDEITVDATYPAPTLVSQGPVQLISTVEIGAKGDKGDQGDQGKKGDTGDQGPAGAGNVDYEAGKPAAGRIIVAGTAANSIADSGKVAGDFATAAQGATADTAIQPSGSNFTNTGLRVRDTNASHSLIIAPGSNITADRTLTLTTGDASRTLSLGGDLITGGSFSASSTFAVTGALSIGAAFTTGGVVNIVNAFATSGAFGITLTATATTAVTLPTTGTLATLAGAETFSNKSFANAGVRIFDTDSSHGLFLAVGSNLTADRIFTITTGDAARTLSLGGNLTTASTLSTTGTFSSGGTFSTSSTFAVTGALSIGAAFTTGGAVSIANAFTTSGAFAITLTATGTTSVTLPTSGTLATTAQIPVKATGAEIRVGTDDAKFVTAKSIFDAAVVTTQSVTGSTTLDFSLGINWALTLTGNLTLNVPSNLKNGQSGTIYFIQDATGSRTISLNASIKKFGTYTLTTTANAIDRCGYFIRGGVLELTALEKGLA